MSGFQKGSFVIPLADAGAAAGDMAAVLNPEGVPLAVTVATLYITTGSSNSSTIDVGIAANATTSNDTIIDGRSGATAGVFGNLGDPGTNGGESLWGATQYLTVSEASGDVSGLEGYLLVEYKILDFA